MAERFDLIVIGSGPAGEKAAAQAAYFGKRVAVVERDPSPGGDAATRAVVPSKTLRETALYLTGFRRRDVYGLSLALDPEATMRHLTHRANEVVEATVAQVSANLDRHGIEVIRGAGSLGPGRTVLVRGPDGERRLEASVILIATGSRPYRPEGIPFEDPAVHDSESILRIERLPRSLVVVGGGAVGCEYASIFNALGAEVTLVDARPRLIPFLDAELSEMLADTFARDGMHVRTGTALEDVERHGSSLRVRLSDGTTLKPEALLYAAGRAGETEGMGLEAAGVKVDERGQILVDDTYVTSVEGIYAAGDVIGPPALASVSMEQGRVAICQAFGLAFKDQVDPTPPFGAYTIPEVAMAGMTEEDAAAAGIPHETGRALFAENPRARISGLDDGMVKLVFARDDRRLLGVHVLGDEATELVHVGQAVLHAEGTIDAFIRATYNVPSRTDAYKYAAYDGLQRLNKY